MPGDPRQAWPGQQDPRGLGASPRPPAWGSTINTPGPTSSRSSKGHDRKQGEKHRQGPSSLTTQPSRVGGCPLLEFKLSSRRSGTPDHTREIHLRQWRSDALSPFPDGGLGRYRPSPGQREFSFRDPPEDPLPRSPHDLLLPGTRQASPTACPSHPCPGPPFLSGAARNRACWQACQSCTTRC